MIDALDEIKTPDEVHEFLHFMKQLRQQCPQLRILFSSRPQVPVRDYFEDSLQTFQARSAEAKDDMANFLRDQLSIREERPQWKNSIFCKIRASHYPFDFNEVRPIQRRR